MRPGTTEAVCVHRPARSHDRPDLQGDVPSRQPSMPCVPARRSTEIWSARQDGRIAVTAKRSFTANMAITATSNFAIPLSSLLTAPVIARGLGVDGRGSLAAAIAPLLLTTSVATFGLPPSILYHTALRPLSAWHNVRAALGVLVAGGVLSGLATVLLSGWLSDGSSEVQNIIVSIAILIPLTIIVDAFRGAAKGLHRWHLVGIEKTFNGALRLVSIYSLWFTGQMTVVRVALCIALPGIIGLVFYLPVFKAPRGERLDAVGTRELSKYGVKVWGGSISGVLLSRLDQAIMAPLAGVTQLGFYTVGVNVSDVARLVNNAMREVTVASDAAENDNRRLFLTARLSLLISLVMAVAIGGTMWFWFDALFGAEFHPAVWAAMILLGAAAFGTPGSVLGAGLAARGRPGLRSLSLAIGLVVNVVALVALAPIIGAVGAALSTFMASQTASQLNILWFHRRYGGHWRDVYGLRIQDGRDLVAAIKRVVVR